VVSLFFLDILERNKALEEKNKKLEREILAYQKEYLDSLGIPCPSPKKEPKVQADDCGSCKEYLDGKCPGDPSNPQAVFLRDCARNSLSMASVTKCECGHMHNFLRDTIQKLKVFTYEQ
jgi:hypothetical protein